MCVLCLYHGIHHSSCVNVACDMLCDASRASSFIIVILYIYIAGSYLMVFAPSSPVCCSCMSQPLPVALEAYDVQQCPISWFGKAASPSKLTTLGRLQSWWCRYDRSRCAQRPGRRTLLRLHHSLCFGCRPSSSVAQPRLHYCLRFFSAGAARKSLPRSACTSARWQYSLKGSLSRSDSLAHGSQDGLSSLRSMPRHKTWKE